MNLMGGKENVVNKIYQDNNNNNRTDKKYYVLTDSFISKLPVSKVIEILKPENNRLQTLLDDTNMWPIISGFEVQMMIDTPISKYDCRSNLQYSKSIGKKSYFTYRFNQFNMIFTDMAIQVEVKEENGQTRISINQVLALRGYTYDKISKFNMPCFKALKRFEKHLKDNLKIFRAGTGGPR